MVLVEMDGCSLISKDELKIDHVPAPLFQDPLFWASTNIIGNVLHNFKPQKPKRSTEVFKIQRPFGPSPSRGGTLGSKALRVSKSHKKYPYPTNVTVTTKHHAIPLWYHNHNHNHCAQCTLWPFCALAGPHGIFWLGSWFFAQCRPLLGSPDSKFSCSCGKPLTGSKVEPWPDVRFLTFRFLPLNVQMHELARAYILHKCACIYIYIQWRGKGGRS